MMKVLFGGKEVNGVWDVRVERIIENWVLGGDDLYVAERVHLHGIALDPENIMPGIQRLVVFADDDRVIDVQAYNFMLSEPKHIVLEVTEKLVWPL